MADAGEPGAQDRDAWARVNDLFHRALEVDEPERAAFLLEAAQDPRIRAEVTSLLDAHARAGNFIEAPASQLPLAPNAGVPESIGHYRVRRVLGEGGMGVVYLAEDTKLGRTVALKALAPRLVGDAGFRERLRREARAAASLNHPGIAMVYALEEIGEHLYIAGEFVPGETLRDALAAGPLEPLVAIDTALAIARALGVAHEQGIIHRDLKPENVMRTPVGDVKILDFGLARFRDPASDGPAFSAGTVLGTPAYMSPEQIRGEPVDARSDLFALGIMLYESVTGLNPFQGRDPASTIAKILEAEPARWTAHLPSHVSGAVLGTLERVVFTCLRKAPDSRFRSAADLTVALEQARHALVAGGSGPAPLPMTPDEAVAAVKARWWWQFHQTAAVAGYGLLLIPLWFARRFAPQPHANLLFLAGVVSVVVASAIRLHVSFALRLDQATWATHYTRSRRWRLVADLTYVAVLAAGGLLAITDRASLGILLVSAAAAILVAATIIEPATTEIAAK